MHVRFEEGRPPGGSGGVTTLAVRAFGMGSFRRWRAADSQRALSGTPGIQATFIARELFLVMLRLGVPLLSNRSTASGALQRAPLRQNLFPPGRIEAPSPPASN